MSVGILILSHDGIGSSLLGTALQMITGSPLHIVLLTIEKDSDPDGLLGRARLLLEQLDSGAGVLILTDLYGSTPCNIARACLTGDRVKAVAGLNLSMLVRVMNYPDLELAELVEKAVSGGQEGVLQITAQEPNAQ